MKNNQYLAQSNVSPENAKMVVDTIKDLSQINGFGLGVGLIGLLIIGYFGLILHKLIGKLDLAEAVNKANNFVDKTGRSLNDIAEVTSGTDRKVDGVKDVIEEIRDLQGKAVSMGKEMSDKMSDLQTSAITSGKEMSDRLLAIEQHLKDVEANRNGQVTSQN